jgi:glucose/mannose-6-phosphate isomerase
VGGVLDDRAVLAGYDGGDMLGVIAGLPSQLETGWQLTRDLELPAGSSEVTAVVVIGMGGSAIGADLVRAIYADRLRVPIVAVRDYDLPAFAGPRTLVVACSYSGATEETLSALAQAIQRGCPLAAITTGGPLLTVAERAGVPLLAFPGGGQPRASVGYGTILLAGLLERAGLLVLDGLQVAGAAAAARSMAERCAPEVETDANPAKRLAWSLVDRLPIVEGGGFLAAVARRWKTQLNENGKSTAAFEELPEATHNAVVGYAQPASIHERMFVVFLESPDEHPQISRRLSLSAELLAEHQIPHEVVAVGGIGRLAQAFSTIVLGDFVSVYLGILYGLDPTPVEAIARLKRRLAETDVDLPA